MKLIEGTSIPAVWLKAAQYLESCPDHQDFDLILHISEPIALSKEDAELIKVVDAFLKSHKGKSLHTVAETIFPNADYIRGGRKAVFETYPDRMEKIHKARAGVDANWGCYAMRMLRQPNLSGGTHNQLEKVIEKMNRKEKGKNKACYEVVPGRPSMNGCPELEVTTYDPDKDRGRYIGGPCLSLVSFKRDGEVVRLNATYRSHYYMQRTLGNLMGLARLQFFVARETKGLPGPLTINSTFAKMDTGNENGREASWGRGDIASLLKKCESVYS